MNLNRKQQLTLEALVRLAAHHESHCQPGGGVDHHRALRNEIADMIFNSGFRNVQLDHGGVETWWSPSERSFVTQLKDKDGNQISDADYSGSKIEASISHYWALKRLLTPALRP